MIFAPVCAGLMMALLADVVPAISPDLARDYQEARSRAGRSSDDQVRMALWCESHGMARERLNHLTLAILADPGNAQARGLMGLVPYEGRFQRPEAIAEKLQGDPALLEYDKKRFDAPYTADGQWALGLWADEHGLKDQARAHFTAVTRLDPRRLEAWKRLGYRLHEGRWVTEEALTAEKLEAEAQKLADRKWKPILEDWRRRLALASERAAALSDSTTLEDPRAVPSILKVFGGVTKEQPRAVQLLGQIDSPASSRALAIMAVAGRSPEVRRVATETLRGRDPVEYAELLIGMLAEPIRFEVKPVEGLDSPGELLIEGERANVKRVYTPPTPFQPGDRLGVNDQGESVVFRNMQPGTTSRLKLGSVGDPNLANPVAAGSNVLMNADEINDTIRLIQADSRMSSMRGNTIVVRFGDTAEIPVGQMVAEVQKSKATTEKKLRDDVQWINDHNFAIRLANDRVSGVLASATGQALQPDRRAWSKWFVDRVGYASPDMPWTSKASTTQQVAVDYAPPVLPDGSKRQIIGYDVSDCFAAGTPVRTISGPRAIETLKVGDRVLTQDPKTGALGYQPILATHQTASLPFLRVNVRGESIRVSLFHRFWVAGRGWVMARDLKAGDPLRTLGAVSPIESIEPDADQPAYNLDVAASADYFAGNIAALVHDYTQPDPRLIPFDAPRPAIAVKAGR